MTLLKDLSVIWILLHTLVMFALLFESRFSFRKTAALTAAAMLPLCVLNAVLYIRLGPVAMGKILLLSCTLPSLIFFFLLAKNRDWRFVFSFCLADTLSLWIMSVTLILDHYLGEDKYILMFVSRLLIFPILEFATLRYLRRPYLQMQKALKKGWGAFALISMLFYLLLLCFSSYPNLVILRPDDMPAMLLILVMMPLMYFNIAQVLVRQRSIYRMEEESRMLRAQAGLLTQHAERMEQFRNELRIYRHDERHRLQTIAALISRNERESALEYLDATRQDLDAVKDVRWCANPILDAVFSTYFLQAKQADVTIETELALPEELRVDAADLSTVFANALENAINAYKALPAEKRFIHCKCISSPQFMFRISNPYAGEVQFDDHGYPVNKDEDHGIGTRSIASFCEKHGAHCEYKAENGVFTLQLLILQSGS